MPTRSRPSVGAAARIAIALIQVYRWTLSYILGGHCRFEPSCSIYAQQALRLHGLFYGAGLSLRRLGRCHPWHAGGFDPVPPQRLTSQESMSL